MAKKTQKVIQKKTEGEEEPVDLWSIKKKPIPLKQFVKDTIDVEKIIWFGASNSGKTHAYLSILHHMEQEGVPPEQVCMCIVFPDRATGITKLWHLVPKIYEDRIFIFPIHNYEDMVSATSTAQKVLIQHYEKSGTHGWLIVELLEEAWRMSQDYYSRKSYGESLADLMAIKRKSVADYMTSIDKEGKETAYQALEGRKDWVIIKFFHNFNWIDKIKRMPFNVGATSEVKATDDDDDVFSSIKVRPAGEKDNVHRFDTVLYLKHQGNNFYQRCFKLTGFSKLYTDYDITGIGSYSAHKQITSKFEKSGYRQTKIEELEEQAGITAPKTVADLKSKTPSKPKKTKTTPKPAPEEDTAQIAEDQSSEPSPKKPKKTAKPKKDESSEIDSILEEFEI